MAGPVLVVRHEEECPPAWFGTGLEEAGCTLDVRRPYAGEPLPADLSGHGGLLVLGGHMSANDDADVDWLGQTKELVRAAARDAVPTLGICLGHQLAAVALGGTVTPNPRGQQLGLTPVGWLPEAAEDPLVRGLGAGPGVHWNNDVVVALPRDAVALARAEHGVVQAARFAPTVWGVQWHPEADGHVVAPWAAADRASYPPGVVDAAVDAVAQARDDLARAWRPLAEAFAGMVRHAPDLTTAGGVA